MPWPRWPITPGRRSEPRQLVTLPRLSDLSWTFSDHPGRRRQRAHQPGSVIAFTSSTWANPTERAWPVVPLRRSTGTI